MEIAILVFGGLVFAGVWAMARVAGSAEERRERAELRERLRVLEHELGHALGRLAALEHRESHALVPHGPPPPDAQAAPLVGQGPTDAPLQHAALAFEPPQPPQSFEPPLPAAQPPQPFEPPQPPQPFEHATPATPTSPAPEQALAASALATPLTDAPLPTPTGTGPGWERWIGVVLTAGLGALVLVVAGFYFFRFAVDQGYLNPSVRVVLGTLVGLSLVAGSELRLRRQTPVLANWLAGAGVAILYTAFWAASSLYDLIPSGFGFALLVAVTLVAGVLSVRRSSLAIAVLGLLGGFATPMVLATESDRPVALFAYVLLLDLGIVAIARKRRWPALGLLALVGTSLHQALLLMRDADHLGLALLVLVVFAGLFALLPSRIDSNRDETARATWSFTSIAGVAVPFMFALYFATHAQLGEHLWPLAGLLALLGAAAHYVGRRDEAALLAPGAAGASLAIVLAWALSHPLDAGGALELLISLAGLGLLHLLPLELPRPGEGSRPAAAVSALGAIAISALAAPHAPPSAWPFLLYWLVALALAYCVAARADAAGLQPAAALLTMLALFSHHGAHTASTGALSVPAFLALGGVVGAAIQGLGLLRAPGRARALADHAAALAALLLLLLAAHEPIAGLRDAMALHLAVAAFLVLGLLATSRLGLGGWVFALGAVAAYAETRWTLGAVPRLKQLLEASQPHLPSALRGASGLAPLLAQGATLLLLSLWPLLGTRRLRLDPWSWRASALAPVAWFPSLAALYIARFGRDSLGLLPLLIAALLLALGALTRRRAAGEDPAVRRGAFVWLMGATTAFITLAIPLQLEREWITIAWALEGLALALLWRRLAGAPTRLPSLPPPAGLRHFAFALLAAGAIRLIFNPWLLQYHARGEFPGALWLSYTFLVPIAALLGSAWAWQGRERAHFVGWERELWRGTSFSPYATLAVLAAVGAGFVYINLFVFDLYATGEYLRVPSARLPARDLTLSLSWALYSLGLLVAGVRAKSRGLRGLSLALSLVTVGKVFLYDLGALTDLYRVGSLLGLAVSLILISFAYQRFVFRRETKEPS